MDSRSLHEARALEVVVVEEDVVFSLTDFCRACGSDEATLARLVTEGVLDPLGDGPARWRFSGLELRRARTALRLANDLELGTAGTLLALQLLGEIDALRARLRQAGLD